LLLPCIQHTAQHQYPSCQLLLLLLSLLKGLLLQPDHLLLLLLVQHLPLLPYQHQHTADQHHHQ
jgi:hypothetical protein